ncbi:ergothioneine biosynthesis protein EgtB [Alteromonadaceae bacterium Bs31]|nr:ergothioneine biosynthesis protein EgtB [Alteromonadaceae bacterium Bs31]
MHNATQEAYSRVRNQTRLLVEGLSPEDMAAQSMADASPAKWHLAHTTWFFETFILIPHFPSYKPFSEQFQILFNSYYESVGERHPRPQRGLLTRPGLDTVLEYRNYVDRFMDKITDDERKEIADLVCVGLHHEMQHQELLLTDILHLFSNNPLFPAAMEKNETRPAANSAALQMHSFDGGLIEIGALQQGFSYDNERPRHSTFLNPFRLANRLVSNEEWLEFIADGGYTNSLLWLSDGWATCLRERWYAPLYWREQERGWMHFGLDGLKPLDLHAPVCHISYYEADAFARWSGKRLPREQEWEMCAAEQQIQGNFLEAANWRPLAASSMSNTQQLYGDVWEWTQSPYSAYPGFKAEMGALGEYNGKFMANQFVLRGGSCATPIKQMRNSYRNFFYPHQRWQFSGLRLAEDC